MCFVDYILSRFSFNYVVLHDINGYAIIRFVS